MTNDPTCLMPRVMCATPAARYDREVVDDVPQDWKLEVSLHFPMGLQHMKPDVPG